MQTKTLTSSLVLTAVILGALASASAAEVVAPLKQAHAHNDYLHKRPLLDALDQGFNSVEADIFLVDGKLLVAHTQRELKPERTLEALYLAPLRERVKANGGRVYRDGEPFHLLIDIKSAGEPTYEVLDKLLADYGDIVSVVRDGKREQQAVDVVISGSRPTEVMEKQTVRYAGIDGRWGDLDNAVSPALMPLVSDNWMLLFKWRGRGPMPDDERQRLTTAVAKAHVHGRKLRLWATPDNRPMWEALRDAGVDMINTDDLAGLSKFLRGK